MLNNSCILAFVSVLKCISLELLFLLFILCITLQKYSLRALLLSDQSYSFFTIIVEEISTKLVSGSLVIQVQFQLQFNIKLFSVKTFDDSS